MLWVSKQRFNLQARGSINGLREARYEFRALVPERWIEPWEHWAVRNGCKPSYARAKADWLNHMEYVCTQPIERGYWLAVTDLRTGKRVNT